MHARPNKFLRCPRHPSDIQKISTAVRPRVFSRLAYAAVSAADRQRVRSTAADDAGVATDTLRASSRLRSRCL